MEGRSVENPSDEDRKSEITVEDVRQTLGFLSLKTSLPCKILVVSLAEHMNINAQNAFFIPHHRNGRTLPGRDLTVNKQFFQTFGAAGQAHFIAGAAPILFPKVTILYLQSKGKLLPPDPPRPANPESTEEPAASSDENL